MEDCQLLEEREIESFLYEYHSWLAHHVPVKNHTSKSIWAS